MPDTFQIGGYDAVGVPYQPFSVDEIADKRLKQQQDQAAENARIRRQAALDQHLKSYDPDPVSQAWGQAEFRLQEQEQEQAKQHEAEKSVADQHDDPVAKAWAIAQHRMKNQGPMAQGALKAQNRQAAIEQMQRQDRMSAALDQITPDNAFVRESVGGALNAAPDFVALAARLTGSGEAADELNRQSQEMQQARGQMREEDWSPWLSGMYGGAVQNIAQMAGTPGGAYSKIAGAALQAGNQALTTAEDAGLKGNARLRYAGTQALFEGGIAAIFQKVFPGLGAESRVAGQGVAAQTWKQLAKQLGKDALAEMPEEAVTSILQDVSSKLEGVSPDMNVGDFAKNAAEAAIQAAMMSGIANTPNAARMAVSKFVAQPSRKNYEALPEELKQGPANQAQRQALAEQLQQQEAASNPQRAADLAPAPSAEEQAAIDENNRITALKSPGAQPDFVPPTEAQTTVPSSSSGEEVIPSAVQGQPEAAPTRPQLTEADFDSMLSELQGVPVAQETVPENAEVMNAQVPVQQEEQGRQGRERLLDRTAARNQQRSWTQTVPGAVAPVALPPVRNASDFDHAAEIAKRKESEATPGGEIEPSNQGIDAPATAATDEQSLKDSALPDDGTPQDKVQELARIASERGWSVKTMKEKAIEAGVAPGAVRMAAAKMAQDGQRKDSGFRGNKTAYTSEPEKGTIPDEEAELARQSVHESIVAAGGVLKHESESGSRYYQFPNGQNVRVADHAPNEATDRWMDNNTVDQVRVDKNSWKQQLDSVLENNPEPSPDASLPPGPAGETGSSPATSTQGTEPPRSESEPTLPESSPAPARPDAGVAPVPPEQGSSPELKADFERKQQDIRDRRDALTKAQEKLQEDLTAQKRIANRSRSAAAKQKMADIEAEWADAKERHQAEMNKLSGESLRLQETHPYAKEQARQRLEAMKPKQAEQAARDAEERKQTDQHDWQVIVDRGGHEKVLAELQAALKKAAGNTKRMSPQNKFRGESAERSIQRNIDRTTELAAKFAPAPANPDVPPAQGPTAEAPVDVESLDRLDRRRLEHDLRQEALKDWDRVDRFKTPNQPNAPYSITYAQKQEMLQAGITKEQWVNAQVARGMSFHKSHVERSLERGINVPGSVLAEYPDLQKKAQGQTAEAPKLEPWQMGQSEYLEMQVGKHGSAERKAADQASIDHYRRIHEAEVRKAIREGKPVPESVRMTPGYGDMQGEPTPVPQEEKSGLGFKLPTPSVDEFREMRKRLIEKKGKRDGEKYLSAVDRLFPASEIIEYRPAGPVVSRGGRAFLAVLADTDSHYSKWRVADEYDITDQFARSGDLSPAKKWQNAQEAYRARKIGDEEFLAARKEWEADQKAFDESRGEEAPVPESEYDPLDINANILGGRVDQMLKDIGKMPFEKAKSAVMDAGVPAGLIKTRKALVELLRKVADANTPEKRAERDRREKIEDARSKARRVIENADANRQQLLGAPIESDLTDAQYKEPHSDENREAVQRAWAKQVKAAVDQLDLTDPDSKALADKAKNLGLLPESFESFEAKAVEPKALAPESFPPEKTPVPGISDNLRKSIDESLKTMSPDEIISLLTKRAKFSPSANESLEGVKAYLADKQGPVAEAAEALGVDASQIVPVYRGTDEAGAAGLKITEGGTKGDGVYFYTARKPAESHVTGNGRVIVGYVSRNDPDVEFGDEHHNVIGPGMTVPAGYRTVVVRNLDRVYVPEAKGTPNVESQSPEPKAPIGDREVPASGQDAGPALSAAEQAHIAPLETTIARAEKLAEQHAGTSTPKPWYETVNKEAAFAEMRRIDEKAERYRKQGRDLSVPHGAVGVGSADISPQIKADALESFLRAINQGKTPQEAEVIAKEDARKFINNWNTKGVKGRVGAVSKHEMHYWEGHADTDIETAVRNLLRAGEGAVETPASETTGPDDTDIVNALREFQNKLNRRGYNPDKIEMEWLVERGLVTKGKNAKITPAGYSKLNDAKFAEQQEIDKEVKEAEEAYRTALTKENEAKAEPKYQRTTPAPGTPERAELEARIKSMEDGYKVLDDEYEDIDKKYQKAGYGTKLKETLSKRIDKHREKMSKYKVDNDWDGLGEKRRLMWLEDVATQSQVRSPGSTSTGKDEANALAARYKILSDVNTDSSRGEQKRLREQINDMALKEAKGQGLTGEDAEREARSAALYITDFPGSRSLAEMISGAVSTLEAKKSYHGASKAIDALEHLDSYRRKHYRDQLDNYNAGKNERVLEQATQENKDKAAAAKTAKGIAEVAALEEFRKSWSDTVPNRTTVADVLTKEGYINAKVGDKPAISNARWVILSDALPKTLKTRSETVGEKEGRNGRAVNADGLLDEAAKGAVRLTLVGHESLEMKSEKEKKKKKKDKNEKPGPIGMAVLTDGEYTIGIDEAYYNYFSKNGFEFRGRPDVIKKNPGWGAEAALALYKDGELVGIIMPMGRDDTKKNETLASLKQRIEQARAAAPKDTLSDKAAAARQEVTEAITELRRSFGGTAPNIGSFSPEQLKAFKRVSLAVVNAGALTFAEYADALTRELGDMVESLRPLMVQMWPKIAAHQGLDPSTEIDEGFFQREAEPEEPGNDSEPDQPTLFEESPKTPKEPGNGATPEGSNPDPLATKHAHSDAVREAMGLPLRTLAGNHAEHTWESLAERANAASKGEIDGLIADLVETPRILTDYEDALLSRRQTEVINAYEESQRRLAEAAADGNAAQVVAFQNESRARAAEEAILLGILDPGGTAAGRALAHRKAAIQRDYSVARMILNYRAEHANAEPSQADLDRWAEMEAKVKEVVDRAERSDAAREAEEQALAIEKAHNAAVSEVEAEKKSKPVTDVVKNGVEKARKRIENGFKMLGAMKGKVYSIETAMGDLTLALTEIARGYTELGVFSFADAMKRFAKRVGAEAESMRGDFKRVWDKQIAENGVGDIRDQIDPENPSSIGTVAKRLHQFVIERDGLGKSAEDRDKAVAGVHELLHEAMPELTLEQTARILSGKDEPTRRLSEEEIRAEHRAQLQILEDIKSWRNNQRPNAIQEKRPDSDEQRKLRRIRAEAKKNAKVPDVGDSAQHLQSALDSAKTATKNRIADLTEAINSKTRIVASKTVLVPDAELTKLREERDALQKNYDEVFGKKELSDEQRAAALERALDRQIAQLEDDIPKGILYPPPKQPKLPISNPAIALKMARRDELVARRNELRVMSGEQEQRQMAAYERTLATRLRFWQERMNQGDFGPKPPKEPRKLTDKAMALQYEIEKAKEAFANEQERWRIANRTAAEKVKDFAGDLWDFRRDIVSTGEMSPFGRQGMMYVSGHWLRAAKAMAQSVSVLFQRNANEALSKINQGILDRPNAKAGFYKDVPFATKLNQRTAQEEIMIGEWAKRIPVLGSVIKRFGASGGAFLNIARADMMDAMLATLGAVPGKVSPAEVKALANAAGVFTGHGNVEPGVAKVLNKVVYSSLFTMSRIELAVGRPLWSGTAKTRVAIGREYVQSAVGLYLLSQMMRFALAALGDDDEEVKQEIDPRSSDFGKLKSKGTRIDMLGGESQILVLLTRLLSHEKAQDGVVSPLGSTFGGTDEAKLILNFARSRLHPTMSSLLDRFVFGKNVIGERPKELSEYDPTTAEGLQNIASDNSPMAYSDMVEAVKELGYPQGLLAATAAFFGAGLNTYGGSEKESLKDVALKAAGTLSREDKTKATTGVMKGYTTPEFLRDGVEKAKQALRDARTPQARRDAENALRKAQDAVDTAQGGDVTVESAREQIRKRFKTREEMVRTFREAYKEKHGNAASDGFFDALDRLPKLPGSISPSQKQEMLRDLDEMTLREQQADYLRRHPGRKPPSTVRKYERRSDGTLDFNRPLKGYKTLRRRIEAL